MERLPQPLLARIALRTGSLCDQANFAAVNRDAAHASRTEPGWFGNRDLLIWGVGVDTAARRAAVGARRHFILAAEVILQIGVVTEEQAVRQAAFAMIQALDTRSLTLDGYIPMLEEDEDAPRPLDLCPLELCPRLADLRLFLAQPVSLAGLSGLTSLEFECPVQHFEAMPSLRELRVCQDAEFPDGDAHGLLLAASGLTRLHWSMAGGQDHQERPRLLADALEGLSALKNLIVEWPHAEDEEQDPTLPLTRLPPSITWLALTNFAGYALSFPEDSVFDIDLSRLSNLQALTLCGVFRIEQEDECSDADWAQQMAVLRAVRTLQLERSAGEEQEEFKMEVYPASDPEPSALADVFTGVTELCYYQGHMQDISGLTALRRLDASSCDVTALTREVVQRLDSLRLLACEYRGTRLKSLDSTDAEPLTTWLREAVATGRLQLDLASP